MLTGKRLLNNVFSLATLDELKNTGHSKYAEQALKELKLPIGRNPDNFKLLYQYLKEHHRNEYIFKNELFNKFILGRYSLNTASAMKEQPVGSKIGKIAVADFIIFHDYPELFEIKTGIDTLNRLSHQLKEYYHAFPHVNVITSNEHEQKVKQAIPSFTGLYLLTKQGHIHCVRQSVACFDQIKPLYVFNELHKNEREKVWVKVVGQDKLDSLGYLEAYNKLKSYFMAQPVDWLVKYTSNCLRKRNLSRFKNRKEILEKTPYELRELVYFAKWSTKDNRHYHQFLDKFYNQNSLS